MARPATSNLTFTPWVALNVWLGRPMLTAVGPTAAGAQLAHLLWCFVEQNIGIFGHGVFPAPHSLLGWRGQGKPKSAPSLPSWISRSGSQGVLPVPPVPVADLPDPGYCGVFPAAPKLNTPTASNPVTWPRYWPGTGDWTGEQLSCATASSAPQAAPSFVASLAYPQDDPERRIGFQYKPLVDVTHENRR
jgi:hypothetical protein